MGTTPMGARCNDEYDTLRHLWARMHPDKGEQCRREFLAIMVLIRMEHIRWVGARRSRLPIMPEGLTFEALSLDSDKIVTLLQELANSRSAGSATVDLKELLT